MAALINEMNIDVDAAEKERDSSDSSEDEDTPPTGRNFVLDGSVPSLSAREQRNAEREAALEVYVFDRQVKKAVVKEPRKEKQEQQTTSGETELFFFEDRQPESDLTKISKRQDAENNDTQNTKVTEESAKRSTVWFDEDDLDETSKDYKQLRRRFEDVYGRNPAWAADSSEAVSKQSHKRSAAKKSKAKRERLSIAREAATAADSEDRPDSTQSESDSDDSSVEYDYQKACRTFVHKPAMLQKGTLQFERMRDVNRECELRGRLSAIEFHSQLPLALVSAEAASTFGLFRVDGRRNEKLHTAYLDGFGVTCAHFNAATNEVLLGARRKNFYVYDMPSARLIDVTTMNAGQSRSRDRHSATTTESFEVSPDGQFIVFLDGAQLHVVSARTKEWLGQLRPPSRVQSMAFGPVSRGAGYALFAICADGVVTVWDVASRACLHSFTDSGCVRASALSVSPSGAFLATGHATGIVNLYDTAQCLSSRTPSPLCAIENLVTRCTSLRFNVTDELLCIASNRVRKAARLVHVPTRSVFSNFPPLTDAAVAHVENLDFSPGSGYLALATSAGKALLYRIKHFRDY